MYNSVHTPELHGHEDSSVTHRNLRGGVICDHPLQARALFSSGKLSEEDCKRAASGLFLRMIENLCFC